MKESNAYRIAVKSLNEGLHTFQYELENRFFDSFEESPEIDGKFEVNIEFDKRSNFFTLGIDISGHLNTACDRCTAKIALPIEGRHHLIVKLDEEEKTIDPDVIHLDPSEDYLNLRQYLYEYIMLNIPINRTYDCDNDEPRPCDIAALKYLDEQEVEEKKSNPVWDALKEFKN